MKINELKQSFIQSLTELYGADETRLFFNILSDFYLGLTPVALVLQGDKELTLREQEGFDKAVNRLLAQEPIQYIIGETEFYGLRFQVNNAVLIPRPETEELVAWIIEEVSNLNQIPKPLRILDIGTGSGCIAISLAKRFPEAEIHAMDVSSGALEIAKSNAAINEVEVHFLKEDVLAVDSLALEFDIIVSNPPYVRDLEKIEMKANVLENEPHLALFVSDTDPLLFYRKITQLATKGLRSNGLLFFEINQYLSFEMEKMMKVEGVETIELKKDIFDNFRMLKSTFVK